MLVDIYEDGELTAMNVPLARALSPHWDEQMAAIHAIRSTHAYPVDTHRY